MVHCEAAPVLMVPDELHHEDGHSPGGDKHTGDEHGRLQRAAHGGTAVFGQNTPCGAKATVWLPVK